MDLIPPPWVQDRSQKLQAPASSRRSPKHLTLKPRPNMSPEGLNLAVDSLPEIPQARGRGKLVASSMSFSLGAWPHDEVSPCFSEGK